MNARKEPVPKAPETFDHHIFAPSLHGPKDHRGEPIECLHCPLLRWNAVHITSEELAESLPPTPEDDVSDRIIGEAE